MSVYRSCKDVVWNRICSLSVYAMVGKTIAVMLQLKYLEKIQCLHIAWDARRKNIQRMRYVVCLFQWPGWSYLLSKVPAIYLAAVVLVLLCAYVSVCRWVCLCAWIWVCVWMCMYVCVCAHSHRWLASSGMCYHTHIYNSLFILMRTISQSLVYQNILQYSGVQYVITSVYTIYITGSYIWATLSSFMVELQMADCWPYIYRP